MVLEFINGYFFFFNFLLLFGFEEFRYFDERNIVFKLLNFRLVILVVFRGFLGGVGIRIILGVIFL